MAERILLVGSGGREHALTLRLLESPRCERLVVAPGNAGITAFGSWIAGPPAGDRFRSAEVAADDTAGLLALAEEEAINLVVCGPEGPLAAGLGDTFVRAGVRFFGPTRAAAEIESSKSYAKRLMVEAGVPTAAYGSFSDLSAAEAFIDAQRNPVVVKADGLCAGKGVVVTSSQEEARQAARAMLGGRFGQAGARVVIEERLFGPEVSIMAFCDGQRVALLASAEDHKAAYDGDRGPNTGGMGAYSPSPLVDETLTRRIVDTIFLPTVRALAAAGRPFRGLLYGGLMLTADGPRVIEWNGRFGDPETQAVLLRFEGDLVPWLVGAAEGQLPLGEPRFRPDTALCVVLAAEGYPEKPRTGDEISGLSPEGDATEDGVFALHAGTRRVGGRFITAGGRVLGVSGLGSDLHDARERVYRTIRTISWPGMFYRRDIGLRSRSEKAT
jgi:phosphoribosylamine---glycine ligase